MVLKTPLHAEHLKSDAKMGAFAGYDMPLYYGLGVMKEHDWTRSSAGLFDVSHMGQIIIEGSNVAAFFEKITPSGFEKKKPGKAQYTVLTNEDGGILDDLIVTRMSENKFFTVVNAGRKNEDIAWIRSQLPDGLTFSYLEDYALIALQGPKAEAVMKAQMNADLSSLPYMHMIETKAPCGTDIFVSRLGYTGEDGFEISVPKERAIDAWNLLLEHDAVEPVGLAARDSLRLEMGYPLYGHDIDETTSPVEANLNWIISKKTDDYFGFDRIQKELSEGTSRKRVGVKLTDKGVAREGAEIRNMDDKVIGTLTSGGYSPSTQSSIGQGYVENAYAVEGQKIFVHVRGRNISAEIHAMPFVKPKTKSMKLQEAA